MNKNRGNAITLVVPGLFDAVRLREQSTLGDTGLPVLQTILSKASRSSIAMESVEETLLSLFSSPGPISGKPSLARVCACADLGNMPDVHWLRVDPVHLVADKDGLLLHSSETLHVTQQEADMLVEQLNQLYQDRGWEFYAPHPQRWYLRMEQAPGASFSLPGNVMGKNIHEFLPVGEAGAEWNAILSEIQMLFHSADVNQKRNQLDKPAINSVWIWGEGEQDVKLDSPWDCVMADDPLTQGLSLLSGNQHLYPLKDMLTRLPVFRGSTLQVCKGEILIVLGNLADLCEQMPAQDCLRELQDRYITPMFTMLKSGRIRSLTIYPCNGTIYRMRRLNQWMFWKPRHHLQYFLK